MSWQLIALVLGCLCVLGVLIWAFGARAIDLAKRLGGTKVERDVAVDTVERLEDGAARERRWRDMSADERRAHRAKLREQAHEDRRDP